MTQLAWREHPAARGELRDAAVWYESQEPGLGDRLLDEVDGAVRFIRSWPDAAPPYRGRESDPQVRVKRLGDFPYGIVYFVSDGALIIVAYAHEKRRPGYWRHRVEAT